MVSKISLKNIEHTELKSSKTGEKYSFSSVISDYAGFKDVFVHHEIIPPGRKSSGTHFHSKREELVLIMEGSVTVWLNGMTTVLEASELMAFPPGREYAHHIKNETQEDAKILIIASNPPQDEIEFL